MPEEALEHFRECVGRGRQQQADWDEAFERLPRRVHPHEAAELERCWRAPTARPASAHDVPKKGPDAGMIATRKASQEIIQWAAAEVPELIGGSADLAPSTLTLIDGGGNVEAGEYGGRNLHFGIREHAMGAIVNGLVLSGFRAFGAGFLIFSDYMKGSIRLAAIMRIPSTFVFTHDSIGVGEDGPTHQPIEQLVTLRATPNLDVVRPAGLQRDRRSPGATRCARPTGRPCSRSVAPGAPGVGSGRRSPTTRSSAAPTCCATATAATRELILMATGSEVHIANDAAKLLEADGTRVRLVSMPCLDRFAEQDQAYRDSRPAAGGPRAGRRSRRRARSAGTAGSATSATSWRWRASAPPRPRRSSTSTSGSPAR